MSEFAVVGAGPVGLYVACLLAGAGREVIVLDEGNGTAGSRSVGLHPPALEVLAAAGVAAELIARGSRIEHARLLLGAEQLGVLSMRSCPDPYRFVLTLPQDETEGVLRQRLERLRAGALQPGARVVGVEHQLNEKQLLLEDGRSVSCRFVIACDGRRSRVRDALGVPVEGGALDHHYLMADLDEDGSLGRDAAISLGEQGVVESFPLPQQRRRWVARFTNRPDGLTAHDLAGVIASRTGIFVDPGDAPAAAFTAERRFATRLAGGGWALAGDAAHVISPIGGQGMNLGLLGGHALVAALLGGTGGDGDAVPAALAGYDRQQRARARNAARRAGLNMVLGSDSLPSFARRAAMRAVLLPALQPRFARYFTMRGL